MQLISEIAVETKFMKSIDLCQSHRSETIRVFSSSDFKVDFDYGTPEGGEFDNVQLVLHEVSQSSEKSTNEYLLKLQVPVQVSHAFDARIILSHQFASRPRILSLRFLADEQCAGAASALASSWSFSQEQPAY